MAGMASLGDLAGRLSKPGSSTEANERYLRTNPTGSPQNGTPLRLEDVMKAREVAICPYCRGKGFLVRNVPPGHPGFNDLIPCKCNIHGIHEALRARSGLAPSQYDWTFPNTKILSHLQDAYQEVRKRAAGPRGLTGLLGTYGVGKTRLGICAVNYALGHGRPAIFRRPASLIDDLRESFTPAGGESYRETWQRFVDAEVLFLDEIQRLNETPWATDRILELIEARYEDSQHKLTIVAGNLHLTELPRGLQSRLKDSESAVFEIEGPDIRQIDRS